MRFFELLELPFDSSGTIELDALERLLPSTPRQVLKSIYSDHGRKDDFQNQYSSVQISELSWGRHFLQAREILEATMHEGFAKWHDDAMNNRVALFHEEGWSCIDTRAPIIKSWSETGTWLEPPFFLADNASPTESLHLVEGHSRRGILKALVGAGIVDPESQHEVWVGSL